MKEKIKISRVSYYNTLPFLYGIDNTPGLPELIDLQKDTPAICAEKLLSGQVDLGLIPVAVIPALKSSKIVSDYCIGSFGKVETVLLLSQEPINNIKKIYLDYQSRTSVKLVRILSDKLWKIKPEFIESEPNYEEKITGRTAGVIIGNRAFYYKNKYKYSYDLSQEWFNLTKMPFVFACWVTNKNLNENFIRIFNKACKLGINNIEKVISENKNISGEINLEKYLKRDIDYYFDDKKKTALKLFLKYLKKVQ